MTISSFYNHDCFGIPGMPLLSFLFILWIQKSKFSNYTCKPIKGSREMWVWAVYTEIEHRECNLSVYQETHLSLYPSSSKRWTRTVPNVGQKCDVTEAILCCSRTFCDNFSSIKEGKKVQSCCAILKITEVIWNLILFVQSRLHTLGFVNVDTPCVFRSKHQDFSPVVLKAVVDPPLTPFGS